MSPQQKRALRSLKKGDQVRLQDGRTVTVESLAMGGAIVNCKGRDQEGAFFCTRSREQVRALPRPHQRQRKQGGKSR